MDQPTATRADGRGSTINSEKSCLKPIDTFRDSSLADVLAGFETAIRPQPRWSISPEVVLGLFSFEKLVMLKDLETHSTSAKNHPIIMALGGDRARLEPEPSDLPRADELDYKVMPEETFQVLDADSSQQEAIGKAKRGISLVIQGPPGTGKSQTIANLIAEFLAQNKRVLFVSEKQAALKVVYDRLAKLSLQEYCLDAHGHKAGKTEILEQLARALQNDHATGRLSDEELKTLTNLRNQINAYVKALHEPLFAIQRTPFYVHGWLAKLDDAPNLNFHLNSVENIDRTHLNTMIGAVTELVAAAPAWQNYENHPWKNTPSRNFSFQLKSDIQFHLSAAADAAGKIEFTSNQLANEFGLPRPPNLQQVKLFHQIISYAVQSPLPPTEWLGATDLSELRKMIAEAGQTYSTYQRTREQLLANTSPEILSFPDLGELRQRFEKEYKNFWRVFKSSYANDIERVRGTLKVPHKLRYGEARTLVELADIVRTTQSNIRFKEPQWESSLGNLYKAEETDWANAEHMLDWTQHLLKLIGKVQITTTFVEMVCTQPERLNATKSRIEGLGKQIERLSDALSKLSSVLPPDKLNFDGKSAHQAELALVQQRMNAQLLQVDRLEEWIQFEEARAKLESMNLGLFTTGVIAGQPPPNQIQAAFLKRFYQEWLDLAYAQKPALKLTSDQRTRLVEQFRTSDSGQLEIARRRILAQLNSRRPDANLANARSSEISILRRELQRKRHRPIRRLFSEIPNLLLALTPCLMMSPLSVSMFLSGADFEFDVAIFDEASQVVPEDAIASIMRAKQIIVAGDSNQLPPTSFFKTLGIDMEESEADDDSEILESILQECSSFLPDTYLRWHYRSRHESLIAFSNQHIYQNRLVTFPSATQIAPHLGVEFIHVHDGIYDRGNSRTNRVEAKKVADLVFEHFSNYPDKTLGVVAFSEAQKQAIDAELERKIRDNLNLEKFLDPKGPCEFFVKNLESVQGDERDVMFFSIGYGKDVRGILTLNFGPLNGESGARRLNVAITRARLHVKLISSIVPEDINLANTSSRGTQLLRAYMEYARARGNANTLYSALSLDPQAESESPFEEAVYQTLTNRGLILHKQVGCSGFRIDLAVVDPKQTGRYLLGIECDGATYHSAKTARDRDRLRQQVLEGLGWRILRIWSRDWIANRDYQVMRVLDALKNNPPPTRIDNAGIPEQKATNFDVRTPAFVTAPIAQPNPRSIAPNLTRRGIDEIPTSEINQAIINRLTAEFSLSKDELVKQTARDLGFARTGERIQTAIEGAINRLTNSNRVRERNGKIELVR